MESSESTRRPRHNCARQKIVILIDNIALLHSTWWHVQPPAHRLEQKHHNRYKHKEGQFVPLLFLLFVAKSSRKCWGHGTKGQHHQTRINVEIRSAHHHLGFFVAGGTVGLQQQNRTTVGGLRQPTLVVRVKPVMALSPACEASSTRRSA
eukprot:SAG31_NODE_3_length_45830_cov_42.279701_39_plen_150_part_00